jgi:hypothetical protein
MVRGLVFVCAHAELMARKQINVESKERMT